MNKLKVVAIIQARMGSSRLPGKVLMPLGDETVLDKVVRRASRSQFLDDVVVATSEKKLDDSIEQHCQNKGWSCIRGSELDVLSRYVQAAKQTDADIIVRITADCPLIDPDLIDLHIEHMKINIKSVDMVTNMMQESYPLGFAVEAFPRDVLTRMDRLSQSDMLREHVTTLSYESPDLFLVEHIKNPKDLSWIRLTVDYKEDLTLIQAVFQKFSNDTFSWKEAADLVERSPELLDINSCYARKK